MINKEVKAEMARLRLDEKDVARILYLPRAVVRKKLACEMPSFEKEYFLAGIKDYEEMLREASIRARHRKR